MSNQHYTTAFSVDQSPQEVFDAINDVRRLDLIRFGGHLLKGRYDVHNGRGNEPAASPAVHG
jgi:hypothetical protein